MKMDEGLDTGPVAMAERVADRPDMTAGELHDALARARRRPDGARARRAGARHACSSRRSRTTASPTRTRSTRTRRASTGRKPWKRGARPLPRAVAVSRRLVRAWRVQGASRCCARRAARARGAPGTVLDDRLTIACGEGAVRLARSPARRQAADEGGRIPARGEDRAGNAAVVIVRPERPEDAAAIRDILVCGVSERRRSRSGRAAAPRRRSRARARRRGRRTHRRLRGLFAKLIVEDRRSVHNVAGRSRRSR